ncbi:MAG: SagB/ThcOx family dehydrogenase [Acidobacteriia bacterium]|nr:SagB/ThcOx family dehydrogenase [Terriglobia bacterium]
MKRTGYMAAVLALFPALCLAGELKPVALAAPETDGGKPLMQVLKERKSVREFGPGALPMQVLSNLLWAAAGVNRADGRRTAPTASNRQEIDVYVAAADGLYLYDAKGHRLEPVLAEDIRAATGTQAYVRDAAVNLIYVADFAKMGQSSPENKVLYSAADTGFISQNVYLFCASQGLATVVRASVDRDALAKTMKLRPEQRITLAQSVGFVKK